MSNISKLLLIFASSIALLSACNGGGSTSSGGGSGGNGPYTGPALESYSASIPGGGTLTAAQNMVFPAESSATTPVYFNVSGIPGNTTVNFMIQQVSGSSLQQKNVSVASSNLPTLSPASCNFTQQNESCVVTLNLNNSAAGTIAIVPGSGGSNLTPIQITILNTGLYTYTDGTYNVSGQYLSGVGGNGTCSTMPFSTTATVANGQICYTAGTCGTTVEGLTVFNTPMILTYMNSVFDNIYGYTNSYTMIPLTNGFSISVINSSCPAGIFEYQTFIKQ